MKINVGKYDRMVRILLGIVIITLGIIFKSFLGLLGIIPIATGIFRLCPLYMPFRIDTSKKE